MPTGKRWVPNSMADENPLWRARGLDFPFDRMKFYTYGVYGRSGTAVAFQYIFAMQPAKNKNALAPLKRISMFNQIESIEEECKKLAVLTSGIHSNVSE